jgi:hypothetical protein
MFVLYFVFLTRLGSWSFAEHAYRVCTTPEAREFGREIFGFGWGSSFVRPTWRRSPWDGPRYR